MKVCAIVPAYKATKQIVSVVNNLQEYVDHTFVIDDGCPENSGSEVEKYLGENNAISVIKLQQNAGVGAAVITGLNAAILNGFDIAIKVDGDGQMDSKHIPNLISPIIGREADYTKGNRFFSSDYLTGMPITRLIGNAGLSFISKASTGLWHVMDPTKGFIEVHTKILPWLHLERMEKRYFFETDMLYRLGSIDAVVLDIPIPAVYGDEDSNLSLKKVYSNLVLKT